MVKKPNMNEKAPPMTMHPPTPSSRVLYTRLLRYVTPYRLVFGASLLAMAVAAGTETMLGALMKPLVDENFVNHQNSDPLMVPLAIVGVALVRAISTFINDYSMTWLSNQVVLDLREQMFRRLLALPVSYYNQHPAGTLIANIAFHVNQVTVAGVNVVTVVVKDSLTVIGLIGLMFWVNWQLAIISLVIVPFVGVCVRWVTKRTRGLSREAQQVNSQIVQVLDETIACQRVVKVFGGQPYEYKRFMGFANRVRQLNLKQIVASQINSGGIQLLIAFSLALIVYVASLKAKTGQLTAGDFVSFMVAMLAVTAPIKRITGVTESMQRGLAAAEIVFGFVDATPENDQGTQILPRAAGAIRFENIGLDYGDDGRHALDGIDLDIRAGETLALVGASGSGKTSLVNLLPRFYEPSHGRVLLDGIPINDLTMASLRENLAMVSQDVMLFNDTIAANIAYARTEKVSEEDITEAARAAYALEFIDEMPEGLNTMIGDKGVRLSGGQKQRLAMARAFLKNAPVLILDEATSALDTQSERFVQAALETLMQGRTTIVIAHRLSTIEKADRIAVMDKGKIVEIGTHQTLLQQNGVYARLHAMQFVGE